MMFARRDPKETRREARETVLAGGTPEGTPYFDFPVFSNGTTPCGALPKLDDADELVCRHDHAKSFYGKAHVWVDRHHTIHLMSYRTEVMRKDADGNFTVLDGQPQSNTTARHMREFALQFDGRYFSKPELKKLPTFDDQQTPDER